MAAKRLWRKVDETCQDSEELPVTPMRGRVGASLELSWGREAVSSSEWLGTPWL